MSKYYREKDIRHIINSIVTGAKSSRRIVLGSEVEQLPEQTERSE